MTSGRLWGAGADRHHEEPASMLAQAHGGAVRLRLEQAKSVRQATYHSPSRPWTELALSVSVFVVVVVFFVFVVQSALLRPLDGAARHDLLHRLALSRILSCSQLDVSSSDRTPARPTAAPPPTKKCTCVRACARTTPTPTHPHYPSPFSLHEHIPLLPSTCCMKHKSGFPTEHKTEVWSGAQSEGVLRTGPGGRGRATGRIWSMVCAS
jgi:hypothetical protein